MRTLLFFAALPLFANTCTSPIIDDITHQGARIQWRSDVTTSNSRINYWWTGAATCTSGSPCVQYPYAPSTLQPNALYEGYSIAGLPASTVIDVSVQSFDGSTWCTGATGSFTTLATPASHGITLTPTPPTQPSYWNGSAIVPLPTTPPAVTGTVYTVGGNCPDFETCLHDAGFGDEIILPAGISNAITPADAGLYIGVTAWYPPPAPDASDVLSANINQGASTFTLAAHGFTEAQPVRLDAQYYLPSPIQRGYTYFIKNATTNTFQLALTSGGSAITLLDSGSGDTFIIGWPIHQSSWITIRTSAADSALPPAGVRLSSVDPNFAAKYASSLAYIKAAPSQQGGGQNLMEWFNGPLAHNYYFIGVATLAADTATAGTETDPASTPGLWSFGAGNSAIVLDRCWIHGLGYPNRARGGLMSIDGSNMLANNSSIDGMSFWRPWLLNTDQVISTTSSTFTVSPGTFHMGSSNCTISSPAVGTVTGGTATGTGLLYWTEACGLVADLPTGITATGSGMTITTHVTPTWPASGAGRTNVGEVGFIPISVGAVLSSYGNSCGAGFNQCGSGYSIDNTEGSYGVYTIKGPGPTKIDNNYIEDTGIPIFWSDDASMNGSCQGWPAIKARQARFRLLRSVRSSTPPAIQL